MISSADVEYDLGFVKRNAVRMNRTCADRLCENLARFAYSDVDKSVVRIGGNCVRAVFCFIYNSSAALYRLLPRDGHDLQIVEARIAAEAV